jgi:predicted glutamine amidotransferase
MLGAVFREKPRLDAFRDLQHVAEIGPVPDQGDELPGHRDGWGIASFRAGSPRYMGRSERAMHMDPSYDSALRDVASLEGPNIVIAHARRGSEGSRSMANTHPFISDNMVFAHNGTVKGFHPTTTRAAKGQTDSERLFMALLDRVDEKRDLGDAIKSLVREDIGGHEFTAAIMMVSDGARLYGYRGYAEERNSWYYTLRVSECANIVTLFQETIHGFEGDVIEVPNGGLVRVDLDLRVSYERVL